MNNKFLTSFIAFFAILLFSSVAVAKYRTYEVVEVTENSITIQSKGGEKTTLDKDPKSYKVGDKVRYDSKRNRLKKYLKREY